MLGLYIYPPPKGTEYTAADLEQPDKVIELFGYCGILEGLITKEGWDFLIQLYGYEKLFEMDKAGMWFDVKRSKSIWKMFSMKKRSHPIPNAANSPEWR